MVRKSFYFKVLKTTYLIYIWSLLVSIRLFSQDYSYKNFSVEDGLPQSQVVVCYQDRVGYIWFGTQSGGVSRFDGKTFLTFNVKKGLPNNAVQSIYQDKRGNYWFGTDEGLSNYDGKRFWNYGQSYGISRVTSVLGDTEGKIWFGDYNKGLFRYDGKTFTRFTTKDGLISNNIRHLAYTKDHRLLICTNAGLSIYDGKTFKNYNKNSGLLIDAVRSAIQRSNNEIWISHFGGISVIAVDNKIRTITKKDGLIYNRLLDLYEDSRGYLWISSIGGLCRFDGKKYLVVKTSENQHNNRVYEVIEDKEGNIWAATDTKGACKLTRSNFKHFTEKDGLANNNVWEICQDKSGKFWFATDRGISRYDGKNFRTYATRNGQEDVAFCVYKDSKNILWAGTSSGLAKFDGQKFNFVSDRTKAFKDKGVLDIVEDTSGNIWCGTFSGLVKYDGTNFTHYPLNNNLIITVYELFRDHEGNIWIGTEYNGLYIYNGKQFWKFYIEGFKKDNKIWNIEQDKQDNFWFGPTDYGLIRYSFKTKKYALINTENGLIDDNILSMGIDKNEMLWIGTNMGVSKLDVGEYNRSGKINIRNYGKEEGFLSIECNQNAQYIDSENNIWFGTIGGVTKYSPYTFIEEHNKVVCNTVITGIRLFHESFDVDKYSDGINPITGLPINLQLNHYQNNISFDFRGLSFKNSERVKYKYRLIGLERSWASATKSNMVNYSNLQPGSYTFEVISCNNDNVWNYNPAAFSFRITAPFWQRWWFYVIMITFIGVGIFGFIKLRIYKLQNQKRQLQNIIEERTQELQEEKNKVEEINHELEQINSELALINNELELSNRELEKLSIVARETDNSIYIYDASGQIEWINSAASKMTGYTLEQLIFEKGKSINDISSYTNIDCTVKQAIAEKRSISYEVVNKDRMGKNYWGSCTLTPIFEGGKLRKLVVIETDITRRKMVEEELKEAHSVLEKRVMERTAELLESNRLLKQQISIREWTEKELIKAKDKAEQADRLKSAFLAQMSHEIRTPLNVILSYTSLLKEELYEKLDDVLKSVFFGINSAGRRLIRTIDLILNMSAIQSRTHDLQIRSFSLNNALHSLLTEFSFLINNKNLEVIYNNQIGEVFISADEYSINQIFQNLIDNAIKFTPAGKIEIKLYRDVYNKICVDVRDEGIGISEEYLPHLFKPFMQEEIGYTRKFEGNGLGLALVKKYIEMNNAEIQVESTKGNGTTFTVKFSQ